MKLKTLIQQIDLEHKRAAELHAPREAIGVEVANTIMLAQLNDELAAELAAMTDDDLAAELADQEAADTICFDEYGDPGNGTVVRDKIAGEIERRHKTTASN